MDSVYAALVIQHLKGGWPFRPRNSTNLFLQNFKPSNLLEQYAFRILQATNYNLESAHLDLGKYYEKQGMLDEAFYEYNALITSIPHEMEFYQRAVNVLISKKEYDKALLLLHKSLQYKENLFAYKWIGQIALMKENYNEAINFLQKADLGDSQVVFNLSRSFYYDNQWNKGDEYYHRLQNLAPKSEYFSYLSKLRVALQMKQKQEKPK